MFISFFMMMQCCASFIKIRACIVEVSGFSRSFLIAMRLQNHVKILLDFQYSSCVVYRKFPIYFASVFCRILSEFYPIYVSETFNLLFKCFVLFKVDFV